MEVVNKSGGNFWPLPEIHALAADTKVDDGLAAGAARPEINKQSALKDLKALADASEGFSQLALAESQSIIAALENLEADPALLCAPYSVEHSWKRGSSSIDGPDCPLCDHDVGG